MHVSLVKGRGQGHLQGFLSKIISVDIYRHSDSQKELNRFTQTQRHPQRHPYNEIIVHDL